MRSYLIRSDCPWRLLPKDFPPFTTVQNSVLRLARQRIPAVTYSQKAISSFRAKATISTFRIGRH